MGAMIYAEIGDFSRFDSPDKVLAYAGASPSTYQSGQLNNAYAPLAKKRAEGKHYNVAISHAAKKLVRPIFDLQKSGQPYRPAA